MASSVHTHAKLEILQGNLDLVADAGVKLMLAKSTYADDPDQDFIDSGGANDLADHEADCTGYAGGFGGAGRQAIANRVFRVDDANDRVEFDFDDESFGSLGGASNNTLGFVALVKEITNDAASIVVAVDDVGDLPTNGSEVIYAPNAEGMILF